MMIRMSTSSTSDKNNDVGGNAIIIFGGGFPPCACSSLPGDDYDFNDGDDDSAGRKPPLPPSSPPPAAAPRRSSPSRSPPPSGGVGGGSLDRAVLCPSCVRVGLERARSVRHRAALEEEEEKSEDPRNRRRQGGGVGISSSSSRGRSSRRRSAVLSDLQDESCRLRARLQELQSLVSDEAVSVARNAAEIEGRQLFHARRRAEVMAVGDRLRRYGNAVNGSSMSAAIESTRRQVRISRFTWAVQAFEAHRLDSDSGNGGTGGDADSDDAGDGRSEATERDRKLIAEGRMKHARGVGKIGGLPLPHAGPELFGVLPPLELQSALRQVASLTNLVARCLGINLPHPVLLTPPSPSRSSANARIGNAGSDDITAGVALRSSLRSGWEGGRGGSGQDGSGTSSAAKSAAAAAASGGGGAAADLSGSTASIASLLLGQSQALLARAAAATMTTIRGGGGGGGGGLDGPIVDGGVGVGGSAARRRETSATTLRSLSSSALTSNASSSSLATADNEAAAVQRRIQHSRAAILAERNCCWDAATASGDEAAATYALSVDVITQDEFAIALQLLQNDVVALCIRAGVPVDRLWPAEAMLLNLQELFDYCNRQVLKSGGGNVDVSAERTGKGERK